MRRQSSYSARQAHNATLTLSPALSRESSNSAPLSTSILTNVALSMRSLLAACLRPLPATFELTPESAFRTGSVPTSPAQHSNSGKSLDRCSLVLDVSGRDPRLRSVEANCANG